jgi:hypothetical protein
VDAEEEDVGVVGHGGRIVALLSSGSMLRRLAVNSIRLTITVQWLGKRKTGYRSRQTLNTERMYS